MSDVIKIKWKPFPCKPFNEYFEISNLGLVRSKNTGEIIKRCIRTKYIGITLCITVDGKKIRISRKIHRMVAMAFIKNDDPDKKIWVNHINGDKLDCSVINLEWVTPPQNAQHAADNGLVSKTKRVVIQFDTKTKEEINRYDSILEATQETEIDDGAICKVCSGERNSAGGFGWKYAENNPNQTTDIDFSKYKQIVGFPNYLLNNEGKIYSMSYKKYIKYQNHPEGGSYVQLTEAGKQKDFFVHRLVASHFLKKEDGDDNHVKHLDKDKTNNNVKNLVWAYMKSNDPLPSYFDTPYYNPKTAIKPKKRKSPKSGRKDLLTANPKNLSKKQREEKKKLMTKQEAKKSGSKTTKKVSKEIKNKSKKKINSDEVLEI